MLLGDSLLFWGLEQMLLNKLCGTQVPIPAAMTCYEVLFLVMTLLVKYHTR